MPSRQKERPSPSPRPDSKPGQDSLLQLLLETEEAWHLETHILSEGRGTSSRALCRRRPCLSSALPDQPLGSRSLGWGRCAGARLT